LGRLSSSPSPSMSSQGNIRKSVGLSDFFEYSHIMLKKLIVVLTAICLIFAGCQNQRIILPGKNREISSRLNKAMEEVEAKLDKPLHFYNMKDYPDQVAATNYRGLEVWTQSEIQIWIDPNLENNIQEAVVAHELGHVIQNIEGYCEIEVIQGQNGLPLFAPLGRLASAIDSMVLDRNADKWAEERGFDVKDEMEQDALARALGSMNQIIESGQVEYTDWNTYYDFLNRLSEAITTGQSFNGTLPWEFFTQEYAVNYLTWKYRFTPYGLFGELDGKFRQYFPNSYDLAEKIDEILVKNGTSTQQQCFDSMVATLKLLKIPNTLMKIRNPKTGKVIWP
jgi:hypothetical protein